MTTPVNAVTALPAEQKKEPDNKQKFDNALAKAQFDIPVDQLAQMGVAVLAPLFMNQMQDIIGEAMGGED